MKKSLSLFLILLCFIHFTTCFHSVKKHSKNHKIEFSSNKNNQLTQQENKLGKENVKEKGLEKQKEDNSKNKEVEIKTENKKHLKKDREAKKLLMQNNRKFVSNFNNTNNTICQIKFGDDDIIFFKNDIVKNCTITNGMSCIYNNKTETRLPYDLQSDVNYITPLNCDCIVHLYYEDDWKYNATSFIEVGVSRGTYNGKNTNWQNQKRPSYFTNIEYECFSTIRCQDSN